MESHPENLAYLNDYMAGRRHDVEDTWLSIHLVAAEDAEWNSDAPVYVDVGGSVCHQCTGSKAMYSNLPRRIILTPLLLRSRQLESRTWHITSLRPNPLKVNAKFLPIVIH